MGHESRPCHPAAHTKLVAFVDVHPPKKILYIFVFTNHKYSSMLIFQVIPVLHQSYARLQLVFAGHPKKTYLVGGFNPSEQYESQLG